MTNSLTRLIFHARRMAISIVISWFEFTEPPFDLFIGKCISLKGFVTNSAPPCSFLLLLCSPRSPPPCSAVTFPPTTSSSSPAPGTRRPRSMKSSTEAGKLIGCRGNKYYIDMGGARGIHPTPPLPPTLPHPLYQWLYRERDGWHGNKTLTCTLFVLLTSVKGTEDRHWWEGERWEGRRGEGRKVTSLENLLIVELCFRRSDNAG